MQDLINRATSFASKGAEAEPPTKKARLEENPPEEEGEVPLPDKASRSMLLRYHAQDPELMKKICNEEFQRIQGLSEEQVQEELLLIKMHHGSNLPGNTADGVLGMVGIFIDKYFGLQDTAKDLILHPQLPSLVEYQLPMANHWSSIPMQIGYIILDIVMKKKIKT